MAFRKRFRNSFRRVGRASLRNYGSSAFSSAGRSFKRVRRYGSRNKKLLGMSTGSLAILGILSYFFVKPVNDFVNTLIKKK